MPLYSHVTDLNQTHCVNREIYGMQTPQYLPKLLKGYSKPRESCHLKDNFIWLTTTHPQKVQEEGQKSVTQVKLLQATSQGLVYLHSGTLMGIFIVFSIPIVGRSLHNHSSFFVRVLSGGSVLPTTCTSLPWSSKCQPIYFIQMKTQGKGLFFCQCSFDI